MKTPRAPPLQVKTIELFGFSKTFLLFYLSTSFHYLLRKMAKLYSLCTQKINVFFRFSQDIALEEIQEELMVLSSILTSIEKDETRIRQTETFHTLISILSSKTKLGTEKNRLIKELESLESIRKEILQFTDRIFQYA